MNIQAEKLELVRMILDIENPGLLTSIKKVLRTESKKDFWDTLPQYQKEEILKGIEEVENGEVVDYEEIIGKHR